jgi:PHD/YefM family antitoxin component YafN of YafNO toxin-antitoxin module
MTAEAKSEERTLEYVVDAQGNKKYVLLPVGEYEALIEKLEDLEDVRLYDEAKANDDGTRVSLEEVLENTRDFQLAQERRGGETISLEELKKELGR